MNHIEIEDMAAYVAGRIKGIDALQIEKHIEVCPVCQRRVKTHHYIRNNFDQVWEAWTSKTRRERMLAARTASALFRSLGRTLEINLRSRIESWIERLRSDAGIAWCAAVDSADKAVRIVRERLEELPPLAPDQVLQPVAIRTRGAVRTRGKGKEPRTSGGISLKSSLLIEKSQDAGGYSIRIKSALRQEPLPLVILIPQAGGEPVVCEFRKTGNELVAEFKNLPNVGYDVVVEGITKKKT